MFISRVRTLVVPQHEHARMAGAIAMLWGNARFHRPVMDFDAFIKGVLMHDWAYGLLDTLPIGSAAEEDWLQIARQGGEREFMHPVTDVVVKLHIRRLLGYKNENGRRQILADLDERIYRSVMDSGFTLQDFLWADRITSLCDTIAFHFAFEDTVVKTLPVFARHSDLDETAMTVGILNSGEITIHPWPLSVEAYPGVLVSYRQEGYPQVLDPVIRCFTLLPG